MKQARRRNHHCALNNNPSLDRMLIHSPKTVSILTLFLFILSTSTYTAHAFMQSKQYVVLSPQRSSYYNQFNPYIPLLKTSYPLRMAKQSNVIDSSISSTDFSVHSSSNNHSLNSRIENLLCDDHDEEDEEVPDYSEEAAKEIADKSIYSRISESAKWKANMAIKTRPSISMEQIDMKKPSTSKRKYKSKMTASVKETGVDTISDYVKSMGQHELLPHESEILLGRQIQILVKWESKRQELEDSLSRYVVLFHIVHDV